MGKPFSPEELAEAFRLKDRGWSAPAIAKLMGRNRRGVAAALAGPDWRPTYRVAGWPAGEKRRKRK